MDKPWAKITQVQLGKSIRDSSNIISVFSESASGGGK